MKDVLDIMSKLTGVELGKLIMKDTIGTLTGISRTYSEHDFEIVINKLDWSEKKDYLNYTHLCNYLMVYCLFYLNIVDKIEKKYLVFQTLSLFIIFVEKLNIARQLCTHDRIARGMKHKEGEFDDPGNSEVLLRDTVKELSDFVMDSKDDISEIYSSLKDWIIQYFSFRDLLKELSERLGLPELARVVSDTLSNIEAMNKQVDDLPEQYKGLFQKIDIGELEKQKKTDFKEKIEILMTLVGDK